MIRARCQAQAASQLHLQLIYGLGDAPAVALQGGPALLQGHPVDRLLHLITTTLFERGVDRSSFPTARPQSDLRKVPSAGGYLATWRPRTVLITDPFDAEVLLLLRAPRRSRSAVVVVVGGVWFGCVRLLHHGLDRRHVDRSVPDSRTNASITAVSSQRSVWTDEDTRFMNQRPILTLKVTENDGDGRREMCETTVMGE